MYTLSTIFIFVLQRDECQYFILVLPTLNFVRQMQSVQRQTTNPSNANLTYTVSKDDKMLSGTQASETLNTLLDQEVALELNRVVVTVAERKHRNWLRTSFKDICQNENLFNTCAISKRMLFHIAKMKLVQSSMF